MKINFKHILTLALAVVSINCLAQNQERGIPFNGKIVDALGNPVKNARVWTTDDCYFSKSDKKGRFGMTNIKATDTLHVKYQREIYDIPVQNRKSISIIIGNQIDKQALIKAEEDQDLVDLGYGYVKRRECLEVTSGISGDVLRKTGAFTLSEALKGRIPGLSISTDLNGNTDQVSIRGIGTFYGSTAPLYIVDGIEVESLDVVNLMDVDNVEVLKGANMYGAKGGNGVIMVHTKRGKVQ